MKNDKKGPSLRPRKPFELMARLSSKEIKDFGDFLASPFFIPNQNRRETMLTFYNRVVKLKVWERDIDKLTFVKGTKISSKANAFDKLVSAFYDLLINYISIIDFQKEAWEPHRRAIKFYRERGVGQVELQKRIHLAEKFLSETPENGLHFRNKIELEVEKALSQSHRSYKPSEGRTGALHQNLDQYYYIEKLRFLCATLNEQYIFPAVVQPPATAEILQWIDQHPSPSIIGQLYYLTFQILNGQEEVGNFSRLKSLLEQERAGNYPDDLGEIYGYLINLYIRRLNLGDYSCLPELDQLYMELLKTPILYSNDELSDASFKNIVSVKARRGNFEDAREFVDTYVVRLQPEFQSVSLEYNHAVILFHEKRFAEAIKRFEALMQESLEIKIDQFYGLDIRCFLLKSYFEEMQGADWRNWESLDEKCHALMRSLQAFIDRRKIPERRKRLFHEFLTLFRELLSIQNEAFTKTEEQSAWTALQEKVMKIEFLSDREWFLEKITRGQQPAAP